MTSQLRGLPKDLKRVGTQFLFSYQHRKPFHNGTAQGRLYLEEIKCSFMQYHKLSPE